MGNLSVTEANAIWVAISRVSCRCFEWRIAFEFVVLAIGNQWSLLEKSLRKNTIPQISSWTQVRLKVICVAFSYVSRDEGLFVCLNRTSWIHSGDVGNSYFGIRENRIPMGKWVKSSILWTLVSTIYITFVTNVFYTSPLSIALFDTHKNDKYV